MQPGDHNGPDNRRPLSGDEIDGLLHDLRVPLSVIHGYAQLLEHHLQKGNTLESGYLLERLALVERACRAIDTRLQQVEHDR